MFTRDNLLKVAYVGIGFIVVGALGIALIGSRVLPFLLGLPVVFALAFAARFLAGNGLFVDWGIEYVIFALGLGLLISNTRRHAGMAQARGADRVLRQDRPRHPRRFS